MKKIECLAMILAGGQGSRLGCLTKKIAKPAVPFGGKYRIIDFPLSNCANSGIETVGVLTQYKPLELHTYLGTGETWNLDRKNGGVYILPPYAREKGADWYKGTADAIYQNINFIETYDPDYVLILSGDHIYTMDYSWMLEEHKMNKAEATISVIKVPIKEASRFGIMTTDKDGRIVAFEEKPQHPQSNLASMGIYIFNWKLLKHYLEEDSIDSVSSHDFGKNIIPKMLSSNVRLFSYSFDGYWKDVGTIESLWQANMDLLKDNPSFDLGGAWRIYSSNHALPPHFIGKTANVKNSLISSGAIVEGSVKNSVIFSGVKIGAGAKVNNSVVMPFSVIGENAVIEKAIIAQNCEITKNAQVMSDDNSIAVIPEGEIITPVDNGNKQVG
ncbi:glucose-1-phosphate adenylyltransferase [Pectinatus sottacetonis]|uniref:glucose-1-phosphate adenylyltransferase n=1 Tax=Pectinatus sottacetonis TaxID=1002795 RepID=UPI0018C842BD|nr:glucose-1-phosphate adenylyltransferase [Pectinatus sottacetonis]